MALTALVIDMTKEPEDITTEDFEALASLLIQRVNEGYADPLLGLDDVSETNLLKLAYHNQGDNLGRLERAVRGAIVERGDGEAAARRFTLKSARDTAKDWRAQIFEARKLENAIRRRNFKMIDGGLGKLKEAEARSDDDDTRAKLISNSSFLKAVGIIKSARPGRIWFDTFLRDFRTDWDGTDSDDAVDVHQIDDKFYLRVYEWLIMTEPELGKGLSMRNCQDAVMLIGFENERSEPYEWITAIEWDGVKRIDSWLSDVYGVDRNDYHRDVGRIWMISMAARIMRPGCKVDTMPVLIGPQGNGKSTSLSILGGRWYATINTSIDKQSDFLMTLNGLLVAEIAELDAISRAADSRVKSMLSTFQDKYRPPYGRVAQTFDRTAVLVGSTNDKAFHKDDSGGRRYLPIETYRPIDLEWLRNNRDQLFAEALAEYKAGASWWAIDRDEQERRMIEYSQEEPWTASISNWFASHELWTGQETSPTRKIFPNPKEFGSERENWGTMITTRRVLVEALGILDGQQTKANLSKAKKVLTQMGLVEKTIREEGRGRGGRTIKAWRMADPQSELDIENRE